MTDDHPPQVPTQYVALSVWRATRTIGWLDRLMRRCSPMLGDILVSVFACAPMQALGWRLA
ncbi:hypothetical protein [Pseudomonas sp.]|uniref:hypothetical protein n=1 Tax=Pseudomonas sp. TaxID=306 RepID=UPI0028AC3FF0|nr:hypothetical protein [Pseudomonas sp.]